MISCNAGIENGSCKIERIRHDHQCDARHIKMELFTRPKSEVDPAIRENISRYADKCENDEKVMLVYCFMKEYVSAANCTLFVEYILINLKMSTNPQLIEIMTTLLSIDGNSLNPNKIANISKLLAHAYIKMKGLDQKFINKVNRCYSENLTKEKLEETFRLAFQQLISEGADTLIHTLRMIPELKLSSKIFK